MVCVASLATTGLFAAWAHLPSVGALVSTGYGRLLVLKLALVAVVLGLGALNWKKLTPRLHEAGGTNTLRRAAAVELLAAQLVLLVTALLVRTSPMGP
jgi:putative copper export protein